MLNRHQKVFINYFTKLFKVSPYILNIHVFLELILEWFVDVDTNSANVKRFEVFGRHVASEIPTHNDNWVKLGEGDFHPFPIECIFKKVIILNFGS